MVLRLVVDHVFHFDLCIHGTKLPKLPMMHLGQSGTSMNTSTTPATQSEMSGDSRMDGGNLTAVSAFFWFT